MARLARLAAAGYPHLVRQGGAAGAPIALDPADLETCRAALRDAASASGVAVHAYRLGPRELRLLATPDDAAGIGRMMKSLARRYVAAFNRRHRRSGPLWERRYGCAIVEPGAWLLPAMVFVEHGPSEAAALSSALHHHRGAPDSTVRDHPSFWSLGNTPFEREAAYSLLASTPLDPAAQQALEHAARHGWALGDEAFLEALAREVGRPTRPRPAGRPRAAGMPEHDQKTVPD